jgi:ssDNA-binding Zn-finger/Zn-ribbon topoisomerase 1
MFCPSCGTRMYVKRERQDVGKFLASVGCVSCLVSPMGCLLAPLAFFLPKKIYIICPKCGTREPLK